MDASTRRPRLTHPGRVLYPGQGLTKEGLASYYEAVAGRILPHVSSRPLTLVRCPQGRHRTCFYQKHPPEGAPSALRTLEVRETKGSGTYLWVEDVEGLLGLVQIGSLEIHAWQSRVEDLERPDRMVFDLDPGEGVAWTTVVAAAHELRDRLGSLDLGSFPLLTGGKGIHVVVPLARRAGWERIRAFSRSLASAMAEDDPDRFVAKAPKAQRVGRIFVDHLRNTRGATAVVAYSTRARRGAPVATPLRWDELTGAVAPDRYSVDSVRRRLAAIPSDPWEGFFEARQTITRAAELRLELAR